MTQEKLFTPTPELMQEWLVKWKDKRATVPYDEFFALQAAQWGANQELEACCEWISMHTTWDPNRLRTARRPKSLSLKEQAFEILDDIDAQLDAVHYNILRRALEQLND